MGEFDAPSTSKDANERKDADEDDEGTRARTTSGGALARARARARFELSSMWRSMKGYYERVYRDERSLRIFDINSRVRRGCTTLSRNEVFEVFVLCVVGFNAAVLAMELPQRAYDARGGSVPLSKLGSWIVQVIFAIIFTFEASVKIVANGFAIGENAYLRSWSNVFDFVVVVIGIVDLSMAGKSAVATLRLIRTIQPLRALNKFKSGRMVLDTMQKSIPLLLDVVIFMSWFVIVCTVIGVMMFGGHLSCRKYLDETESNVTDVNALCGSLVHNYGVTYGTEDDPDYPPDTDMCPYYKRDHVYINGSGADTYCCDSGTSPVEGFVNFDNFGVGSFVVLQIMTVDGWNDIAWPTAEANIAWATIIYFFLVVLLGGFFVIQLFTSVICATLGDLEDEAASEGEATLGSLASEKQLSTSRSSRFFEALRTKEDAEEDLKAPEKNELEAAKGITKVRLQVRVLVSHLYFVAFINIVIVLNTFSMVSVTAEQNKGLERFRYGAEFFFFTTFVVEFLLKNFAFGPKAYWSEKWNRLDGLIVISSIVDIMVEYLSSASSVNLSFLRLLRVLRLLRIVRLFKSSKSFERIVRSVIVGGQRIWVFILVWFVFIVMFAVLGTQLFSAKGTLDDDRLSFKDFFSSVVTLFVVSTGENTFEVAWATMKAAGKPAGIYMIVWCLITTSILALVLGILIDSITEEVHEEENMKKRRAPILKLAQEMAERLGFDPEDIPEWLMTKAEKNINRYGDVDAQTVDQESEDSAKYLLHATKTGEDDEEDDGVIDIFTPRAAELNPKQRLEKFHHIHEVAVVRHWLVTLGLEKHTKKSLAVANNMRQQSVLRARQRLDSVRLLTKSNRDRILRQASSRIEFRMQDASAHKNKLLTLISVRCILSRSRDLRAPVNLADMNDDEVPYHAYFAPDERDGEEETFVKQDNFRLMMSYYDIDEESRHGKRRLQVLQIIKYPWFDRFILMLIIASSALLATETQTFPASGSKTETIYFWLDVFFNICFTTELIMKCYAQSIWRSQGAYLRSKFNIMDATVVTVSWVIVVVGEALPIRSLRVLRVLRPLRTVQRVKGLRLVVEAIMSSIPAVGSVCAIGLAILTILSVLGMQFFLGKMHRCTLTPTIVMNKSECIAAGGIWRKAKFNFDSFPEAFLSVFIIATGDNWQDIMFETMDAVGVDIQPDFNHSPFASAYFLLCVLVAMLLWSNLFISALVDNFNSVSKTDSDGSVLITDEQRMWQHAMLLAIMHADNEWRRNPPPKRWRAFIHRFVSKPAFDMLSVGMILINMAIVMTIRANPTRQEDEFQTWAGNALAVWYFLEAILLILAMTWKKYWKSGWNKIDFVVALAGIFGLLVPAVYNSGAGSAFRMIRFLRLFKVIQAFKGLRTLFATFLSALPGVVNVACLSMLLQFIFACLGVAFFGDIPTSYMGDSLSRYANFANWPNAMVALFVCYTGNWMGFFSDIFIDNRCYESEPLPPGVSCTPRYLSIVYFITYVMCGVFFLGNLFITIILDRFSFCAAAEEMSTESATQVIFTTVKIKVTCKAIMKHVRDLTEQANASKTLNDASSRTMSRARKSKPAERSKSSTPQMSRLGSVVEPPVEEASLEAFLVIDRFDDVASKLEVFNAERTSSPSSTEPLSGTKQYSRSSSIELGGELGVEELKSVLMNAMAKQQGVGASSTEALGSVAVDRFARSPSSASEAAQNPSPSAVVATSYDSVNLSDEDSELAARIQKPHSEPSTPKTIPLRKESATTRSFDRRSVEAASARIALAKSAGSSRHASSSEDDDDDYRSVASRRPSRSVLRSTGSVRSRSVSRQESPAQSDSDDESVDEQL